MTIDFRTAKQQANVFAFLVSFSKTSGEWVAPVTVHDLSFMKGVKVISQACSKVSGCEMRNFPAVFPVLVCTSLV